MSFNTIYLMLMLVRMAPALPLIFLLMIHGVSSADWGVSYSPSHICALKNSSVIMSCTYTYPTGHQIMKVFWTKTKDKKETEEFPDLSNDTEYSQRLQYLGDKQQNCTIRLSHVTLKDSRKYYFRFITDKDGKWIGKPGVTLSVTDLQVESPERVTEGDSVRLTCKSSCTLTDRATFIWYRNSQPLTERRDRNNELLLQSVRREDAGRYSCAVHGHNHISPAVQLNVMYPPKSVSVSISPSGEILSGDSVTLICSSDSNPPAEISWFKGGTFVGSGRIFNISKISSDDSGEYKCRSRNQHGEKYSDNVTLNVMYPPRNVSVSISPSGEIVSGDSVTLICSSDSNPPALNFSWFKENESSAVGSGQSFSALQSGRFYCQAHNQHGSQRSDAVTVTDPPRSISVSISPSGEIVSGDSVTLICSSDSNPPALNFSWFKGGTFVGSAPLQDNDGHDECIGCLGKPHAEAALTDASCPHCECMSLASLRSRVAFFAGGSPAARALLSPSRREPARKRQRGRATQRPELSELTSAQPPRASPSPTRERSPIEHGSGMDAELLRVLSKAVEELDLDWAPPEEPSRSRLDEWFLPGRRQAPRQRAAPFFPEVHEELTKSWRAPYSARLHTTHRSALMTVDSAEEKGYEHPPPLDEAVAAHLCPPTAVDWKSKRALPSKPCRTTSTLASRAYASAGQAASALHTMAIFQVFQAKLLRSMDESGFDAPAFRDLQHHLWLNLTEIKDADKMAFLDAPVSPSGLFGPSVEGLTERFTAAQKSSQAMRHFLPKRSSSASASSRPCDAQVILI
ncbi:sialoadhesin-like [Megalobrama amblycephala]|uniref:sialoadhesin-like n=1 Tax=Megalobrama amblycephala TaxID=75352 RepID=UPI0020145346|nr:sialoadhesin-like [Megalobrama amblycephala]